MTKFHRALFTGALITTLIAPTLAMAQSGEVNIYSYREPDLIQPLLDQFTAETGIATHVLSAGDGLIERVTAEGEYSPADLILTVDVGNLASAKAAKITQPIDANLTERVPAQFRDADRMWTALSMRARVFFVSKSRVTETKLNYSDIANPEWHGRLCTRAGNHPYNIGLIASRIALWGEDKTRTWLEKVRDNLAFQPVGSDRTQVKAIFSGQCDLAIDNTYYMGLMMTNDAEPEQKDWANSVRLIYPDVDTDGSQVNAAGVVLAKYAPNRDNANKLIAFLLSDEAQELYAKTNFEYPVIPGVKVSPLVASWGKLNASTLPLSEMAAHRAEAAALVDELKFNEGPQN